MKARPTYMIHGWGPRPMASSPTTVESSPPTRTLISSAFLSSMRTMKPWVMIEQTPMNPSRIPFCPTV